MKLRASIFNEEVEVEIQRQGARVVASVAGRNYELELNHASDRDFLILNAGRVFNCRVDGRLESGVTVDVMIGAAHHAVTLVDPKRLRSALGAGAHGDGAAKISAPMPGKVVRVLVEAGQQVQAGEGIVVVEAMKMQNEMKAPKAGVVISLNATPGATVNAGDVLAEIE